VRHRQTGCHGVMLRNYQTHPAWAYRDPDTGALEPIFSVHYNKAAAFAQGGLLCNTTSVSAHTWQMHLLTNWMGDDGWLKRTHVEFRNSSIFRMWYVWKEQLQEIPG